MSLRGLVVGSAMVGALVGSPGWAETLCLSGWDYGHNSTIGCDPIYGFSHHWIDYAAERDEQCKECPPDDVGAPCLWGDPTWTISQSDTDPLDTLGPLPADGWLYLWMVVDGGVYDYFRGIECRLTGTLIPEEFVGLNGVEHDPYSQYELPDLFLWAPDCFEPPFLVGKVRVIDPTPVQPNGWGQTKALYR